MSRIPTVKVVNGKGYMIINKSDFDATVHKEYSEATKRSPKKATRKAK